MSASCLEALPKAREWFESGPELFGGPPGCLGVAVRTSRLSGSGQGVVWSPSRKSGNVREHLPYVWKLSAVCRPSWLSGSGRQTLPYVREPLPDDW